MTDEGTAGAELLDRHGGSRPTQPVTQEAAEMAVHLAATLVQWFGAGRIHRR